MKDLFALLDQPRLPWLDPETVQQAFLTRSTVVHPDRVHNAPAAERSTAQDRFTELNEAWQCLRDPKERIRHLLELERGGRLDTLKPLPPIASDFYFTLGQACRELDQFLREQWDTESPLLRVRLFENVMEWRERLARFQQELGSRQANLEAQLKSLNSHWASASTVSGPGRPAALPLDRLEEIYREYSYIARWAGQIRERLLRLVV